ncbi:hypothetical protein ACFX5F_01390 [Flavobacterium sp. ZS1P70]|uniref:Phage protein n=1 Tax=Flavobacterium zhoui TaxID=3230414 RepID=A0ABW6I0R9_9FLAO
MKKEEFNIEDYKHYVQPYDYERYRAVNPKLTKKMYEFLRGNGSEWKILCGVYVKIQWTNEVLEEVWYLNCSGHYKNGEIYKNRYLPEKYLALTTW